MPLPVSDRAIPNYLAHVEDGVSMREIARQEGVHPSTILRRVRWVENARDDPAFDDMIAARGAA